MKITILKIKNEINKLIRFACTGIVSAAVDCTVYYLLLHFININFRLIQPISMTIGLTCSFFVNRKIVFHNEKFSLKKEFTKYILVCVICILLSPMIISFYYLWLGEYMVKIPATFTTGLLNYLLSRFFVYKDIEGLAIGTASKN